MPDLNSDVYDELTTIGDANQWFYLWNKLTGRTARATPEVVRDSVLGTVDLAVLAADVEELKAGGVLSSVTTPTTIEIAAITTDYAILTATLAANALAAGDVAIVHLEYDLQNDSALSANLIHKLKLGATTLCTADAAAYADTTTGNQYHHILDLAITCIDSNSVQVGIVLLSSNASSSGTMRPLSAARSIVHNQRSDGTFAIASSNVFTWTVQSDVTHANIDVTPLVSGITILKA